MEYTKKEIIDALKVMQKACEDNQDSYCCCCPFYSYEFDGCIVGKVPSKWKIDNNGVV